MPSAPYPEFNGSEPCRRDPNSWVPADEEGPTGQVAKSRCGGCHVKQECLAWGLSVDEVGIYGGLTTKERQRITGRAPRTINGPLEENTVAAVLRLQAAGFSISETARELNIHMTTVSKYRATVPAEERIVYPPQSPKPKEEGPKACAKCAWLRGKVYNEQNYLHRVTSRAVRYPTQKNLELVEKQKAKLAFNQESFDNHLSECMVAA